MFRDDLFTLKRPRKVTIEGETTWLDPDVIAENKPCHLSVKTISPALQTQSTATVLYDYTLFYDKGLNIEIKPNDIVEVLRKGKQYNLIAGESVPYNLTIQTHCEENKIV